MSDPQRMFEHYQSAIADMPKMARTCPTRPIFSQGQKRETLMAKTAKNIRNFVFRAGRQIRFWTNVSAG